MSARAKCSSEVGIAFRSPRYRARLQAGLTRTQHSWVPARSAFRFRPSGAKRFRVLSFDHLQIKKAVPKDSLFYLEVLSAVVEKQLLSSITCPIVGEVDFRVHRFFPGNASWMQPC